MAAKQLAKFVHHDICNMSISMLLRMKISATKCISNLVPVRKALRRFMLRCIAQKFSINSAACGHDGPNTVDLLLSACL